MWNYKSFRSLTIFSTLLFPIALSANESSVLTLNQYLDQALGKSPAIESAKLNTEGALESSKEGNLLYAPQFFTNFTYTNNSREPANPFSGNQTIAQSLKVGFQKQFDFGLSSSLSHSIESSEIRGFPTSFIPSGVLQNNIALTSLELNQSLWRNFLGKETQATEKAARASSLATHYSEKLKLKETMAAAETTYHRLALAREAVKLQLEVFERSRKILDWATRRVRNQLADKTDMLQAKAAFQAREIELIAQQEEERSARIAFNQARNIQSDIVSETLMPVSYENVMGLAPIKKAESPDSVKAAEEAEHAMVASNEINRQKTLPDFSLFGQVGFNGLDQTRLSSALGESLSTRFPLYVVGVKFTAPLYVFDASDARAGRAKQQLAAEANTRQKRLETEQGWNELSQKFEDAKKRLKLVNSLVESQKEKLEHEKYRLNLGRTSTYQVLTFEQDYAQALINRIRIETEILSLHARMKLFGDTTL